MNGSPKRASNPSRPSGRPEVVLDLPTVSKMLPLVQRIVADLLQRIADASRAALYNSADPASIEKVLTAVVSNF